MNAENGGDNRAAAMVNDSGRWYGTMINMRLGAMRASRRGNMCRTVMVVAIMMVVVWRLWFVAGALALAHVTVVSGLTIVTGALALAHVTVVSGLTVVTGALALAHVTVVSGLTVVTGVLALTHVTVVSGLLCVGFFLVVHAVAIVVTAALA